MKVPAQCFQRVFSALRTGVANVSVHRRVRRQVTEVMPGSNAFLIKCQIRPVIKAAIFIFIFLKFQRHKRRLFRAFHGASTSVSRVGFPYADCIISTLPETAFYEAGNFDAVAV